jgi:phosphoribosylaminoimidazolecarboxamide formyltransferase/IMP cyclohydrolase
MPKAILSVYDKAGLVPFAQGLRALGWTLIASGGTARLLRANQIQVSEVSEYTASPEILSGRVKTLHPAIHGGLLARPTESDQAELGKMGWGFIDLAAVNLYPFEHTVARREATALIRAAAKNHERVTLVSDPADYPAVLAALRSGGVPAEMRRRLAVKGFVQTAHYDSAITNYLAPGERLIIEAFRVQELRYGENPHQTAALFAYQPGNGALGGETLQGKALSYNNLLDLDAAWRAAVSFERPTVCIAKHLSPCGLATADSLAQAFSLALASDPVSAFGGVIAANRLFDLDIAQELGDLFIECIAAPGFSPEALQNLSRRKNLRLVSMPDTQVGPLYELRSVNAGILRQSVDLGDPPGTQWRVVTRSEPGEEDWQALRFAWKACQHVKSNAIVFARGEATVGIGGGQPNRVDCVRIAAQRAGEKARGAVMASDAFFPFPDSVEEAANAGIRAIIQPGGSLRDDESIQAADAHGIAMVFTGVRHFRH